MNSCQRTLALFLPGRVASYPGQPWREESSAKVPGASLDAMLAAARCAGGAELAGVGRRHAPWGHVGIPVGEFAHALGAGSPVRCRAHFPLGRWPWKGGAGSKSVARAISTISAAPRQPLCGELERRTA